MNNGYFSTGTAPVGGKQVPFSTRVIRDRFRMYVPASFTEDHNLVSNYTYLFSQDKSPLSIAIKYSTASGPADQDKQVAQYFSQPIEELACIASENRRIYYRETTTGSKYLSVYSLRFAAEVRGGILFGCFNCSADFREDWRGTVLEMLKNIEQVDPRL